MNKQRLLCAFVMLLLVNISLTSNASAAIWNKKKSADYKASRRYTVWVQPLYYAEQQETNGSLQGYTSHAAGFIFGIDRKLAHNWRVGIGANYVNATQKYTNSPNTHTIIQNYLGILYGSYYLRDQMQIDWLGSAGINNYKDRTLRNNIIATSDSHFRQQYIARIMLDKTYSRNDFKFTTQLNANTIYLYGSPFFQAGSNVNIPSSNTGVFTLGAGFKITSLYKRKNFSAVPELRCIVFYDITSADVNALPAYVIGGPALNTTTTPPRASGQFGVSLTTDINKNTKCALNYDLLVRSYYFNNVLSIKFSYLL